MDNNNNIISISMSEGTDVVRTEFNSEEYFMKNIPPGFYFKPYDWELILEYLIKKINEEPLPPNLIPLVDLYDYHPRDLCCKKLKWADAWYFFTSRKKKYRNGNRPTRTGKDGHWKATVGDMDIKINGKTIGKKKTLVFMEDSTTNSKVKKTNWIMHEFRSTVNPKPSNNDTTDPDDMMLDKYVLCRIYFKPESKSCKNRDESQSNLIQNPGAILPAAPSDVQPNSLQEPPTSSAVNQPQDQPHQIMAIDYQNPVHVGPPNYQSPQPALAPHGLPAFPPIDLLGFEEQLIMDVPELDRCGPMGYYYDDPFGPLDYENSTLLGENAVDNFVPDMYHHEVKRLKPNGL